MNPISEPLIQKQVPLLARFGNHTTLRVLSPYFCTHSTVRGLDIGGGYDASLLCHLSDKISYGLGLDSAINPGLCSSPAPHMDPHPKAHNNLNFLVEDIRNTLGEIHEQFDIITPINFLEHIHKPEAIVSSAKSYCHLQGSW